MQGKTSMEFNQNDGGRICAGFKGKTNDCVVRAIAIVTGKPYREVYQICAGFCKAERRPKKGTRSSPRTGIKSKTTKQIMAHFGFEWTATMKFGAGCTVHMKKDELPAGRLVVNLSRHVAAVIDGTLHDTHQSNRDGTRCVYGYWIFYPESRQ